MSNGSNVACGDDQELCLLALKKKKATSTSLQITKETERRRTGEDRNLQWQSLSYGN